jgi:hypothetical protein
MIRTSCSFACLILVLAFGREAGACDTRHFYNNTKVTFVYSIMPDGSCSVGPYTGPICFIPPGQSADLHYPDSGTSIGVASVDGGEIYPGTGFSVGGGCYIKHSGSTGNIVVNGPANGDVTTCGASNYPCQLSKKK